MSQQATSRAGTSLVYNRPFMIAVTAAFYAILTGLTLLVAGTWKLPFFWIVFGLQAAIGLRALWVVDPDLISERLHPRGKDEDPAGRLIISVLALLQLVVAALDAGRFHFSDHVPAIVQVTAVVLNAAGWLGMIWAMWVNHYFSSAIRLQPDRNQKLIDDGPYKWIRHPGYAFGSLAFVTLSLALGSWISIIPAVFLVMHLHHRTLLEERLLRDGLAGYDEYMRRVCFRWLPGIW